MAKGGYRGGMPMGGMNQMKMMKHAQKMQENLMKMQQELQEKEYEATAGGGVVTVCLDELAEVVGTEDEAEEVALKDALDRFIGTLRPGTRDIFMRRYWAFQSEREIARAHGITAGAVRMSLSRTRAALKRYLNGGEREK